MPELWPLVAGGESPTVDIVAVHGLNPKGTNIEEHAWDTWRKPPGKDGSLWLRDYLPNHLPTARIFLYEYDSTVFSGKESFSQAANEFLDLVSGERRLCSRRPLLLVAHSLGGLLVKQALINAHDNKRFADIELSVKGLMFFGTPHEGGNNRSAMVKMGLTAASIARCLGFKTNDSIVEVLTSGSLLGDMLRESFRHQLEQYRIVSFWEKLGNPPIVTQESATFGLPGHRENIIGLDADHRSICKFDLRENAKQDRTVYKFVQNNFLWLYDEVMKEVNGQAVPNDLESRFHRLSALESTQSSRNDHGARSTTPSPKRPWFVPYFKNHKVRGRSPIVDNLRQLFISDEDDVTPSIPIGVVVQGFPGIGKTTVALEYVFRFREAYDGVFWINASSQLSLAETKQCCVNQIGPANSEWETWCADHTWLLVIDNVDDLGLFSANKSSIMPNRGHGHVLITSRMRDAGEHAKEMLCLDALDVDSAAQVILEYASKRRVEENDSDTARSLAKTLECIPLALQQCGSLVSTHGGTKLSTYEKSYEELMSTITLPRKLAKQNDAKEIFVSFELSYKQLVKECPVAARLLGLLGNLEDSRISEKFLSRCLSPQRRWDPSGNVSTCFSEHMSPWLVELAGSENGCGLQDAIFTLLQYSLLSPEEDDGHYHLHKMTQFWLRNRENKKDGFTDAIHLVENGYPHPLFADICGLSTSHRQLRTDFYPLISSFTRQYTSSSAIASEASVLKSFLQLLLHASDVPWALRDQSKDKRPLGLAVPNLEYLPLVKRLLRRLGNPPILMLSAIDVFFHHIASEGFGGPDRLFRSVTSEFADKSVMEIRDGILGQQPTHVRQRHSNDPFSLDGTPYKDLQALMPLIHATLPPPDRNLRVASGLLGQIALKFLQNLQCLILEDLKQQTIVSENFGILKVMMDGWLKSPFNLTARSHHGNLSEQEQLVQNRLVLQFYEFSNGFSDSRMETINAARRYMMPFLPICTRTAAAAQAVTQLLGAESTLGAHYVMRLFAQEINGIPQLWRSITPFATGLLHLPLTDKNFYYKVRLVDILLHQLHENGKEAGETANTWLQTFLNSAPDLRHNWDYATDPVMDLYEKNITACGWIGDDAKADEFRQQYVAYCDENYAHFMYSRALLGCGAGVFGLSEHRLGLFVLTLGSGGSIAAPAGMDVRRRADNHAVPKSIEVREKIFQILKDYDLELQSAVAPNGIAICSEAEERQWCTYRWLTVTGKFLRSSEFQSQDWLGIGQLPQRRWEAADSSPEGISYEVKELGQGDEEDLGTNS